jgi:hypothetical protein
VSVYVDDMKAFGRMIMCSMIADTSEELLRRARSGRAEVVSDTRVHAGTTTSAAMRAKAVNCSERNHMG